jgi:hypothetical protein
MTTPGTEVLSPWHAGEPFLYPAIVIRVENNMAHVAYLDGDIGTVPVDTLQPPPQIQPGTRVSVNWKNKLTYYPGAVTAMVGRAVEVQFDSDGSREWTSIAKCRFGTGGPTTATTAAYQATDPDFGGPDDQVEV